MTGPITAPIPIQPRRDVYEGEYEYEPTGSHPEPNLAPVMVEPMHPNTITTPEPPKPWLFSGPSGLLLLILMFGFIGAIPGAIIGGILGAHLPSDSGTNTAGCIFVGALLFGFIGAALGFVTWSIRGWKNVAYNFKMGRAQAEYETRMQHDEQLRQMQQAQMVARWDNSTALAPAQMQFDPYAGAIPVGLPAADPDTTRLTYGEAEALMDDFGVEGDDNTTDKDHKDGGWDDGIHGTYVG